MGAPKGLAIILASRKKQPEPQEEDSGGDGYGEGLKAAARDMLDAIKADDADSLAEAVRTMVEMCM